MALWNRIKEIMNKYPFLSTLLSMGWNLTFALINGVLSIVYHSYWYMTYFALYLLLGLMKISIVRAGHGKVASLTSMHLYFCGLTGNFCQLFYHGKKRKCSEKNRT